MQIVLIIVVLLIVGALTWIAWRKPGGWLSRLSPRGRFFVTLCGAALMTGLFVAGNPQHTQITVPLMVLLFGIALALRYYKMRKKVC